MHFVIYCHTHHASGKRYVGQTAASVERRWRQHVADAKRGLATPFARALSKYGAEAFSCTVLEVVHDQETANAAEVRWIAQLQSQRPHGFNLSPGGGAAPFHAETRRKMSERAKAHLGAMPSELRSERSHQIWAGIEPAKRKQIGQARARVFKERFSPEERSAMAHAASEAARSVNASRTAEERSENARKANASRTPEERSASCRKAHASRTPEQRAETARKRAASYSSEQRAEAMRKMHAKRRAAADV